jgi:cellulose synthase/poly-beta-1,6-N-acetylglucosamine synthase-like glycosyltransferase
MDDIRNQSYKNFEVIVVDDHSTDNTSEIIRGVAAKDLRVSVVANAGEGKKAALTTGVRLAKGKIIVTTDADCRVEEQWLQAVAANFQHEKVKLVFGGVRIEGQTFFSRMQSHEFLSLVGTAVSTLWWGFPSMCNGANLAFRRSVFFEVDGYEDNFEIPSGDDEFLMHKVFNRYRDGIHFIAAKEAIVRTSALAPREFIQQRIRWAGKWSHNLSIWNIILAMFIFFFQMSAMVLPIVALGGFVDPYLACTLFLAKAGLECIFLKDVARFSKVRWNWSAFLALQIIYPFYAVTIAVISSSFSFEWKGRTLKSFTVSSVKK